MQEEIEADTKDRYPVFKPEQFRAVYFDYYKIQKGISVIIYTFTKEIAKYGTLRSAEERKRQIVLAKALGIGYKEKQICVSKKECIDTVCVKYNGEDEVI